MAIDFRQERRFKLACAKSMAEVCEEKATLLKTTAANGGEGRIFETDGDSNVTLRDELREEAKGIAASISNRLRKWLLQIERVPPLNIAIRKSYDVSEKESRAEVSPSAHVQAFTPRYEITDMEAIEKEPRPLLPCSYTKLLTI